MMKIGIDKIGLATAQYKLDMADLAKARGVELEKFTSGLMLDALSITPVTEDVVTLATSAAHSILTDEDREKIDMVIVATESGIDQSKAASVYVHSLLGIQAFARCFEMKEACYSATAALDYARLHVSQNPESRVLIIASDIAKYGIQSSGEPTQGAGAIAMLVTQNPRILTLSNKRVAQTRDVMDFWRPNYSETPFVNGVYSTKQYLDTLKTTWKIYQERYQTQLSDFAAFCFHIPFPKLALKGLNKMMDKTLTSEDKQRLEENFTASITYSRQIGNIYTGSLYLGFLSLLENASDLKSDDKIGFFSYGSGAVCEIFEGQLVEGFEKMVTTSRLKNLQQRQTLSVSDYEKLFFEDIILDDTGSAQLAEYRTGAFALTDIKEHQRQYHQVTEHD